jgi:acyl-coenzyme A thioesterase PaaI-like protein
MTARDSEMTGEAMAVPAGFEPLFRTSPYTEAIGPLYCLKGSQPLVLGVRILEKHVNARGLAHGGLLLTMADIALGYAMAFREDPPASLITASLSADFAGSARIGDWVEAHVDIQKSGSHLAFANAYLIVGGERILRASAVFTRVGVLPGPSPRNAAGGGEDG